MARRAEARYTISAEDRTQLALQSAEQRLQRFEKLVGNVARGTGAIVSLELLRRSVMFSDSMNVTTARIEAATRATGDFQAVYDELLRTAIDTGTEFETNVATFQALSRSRLELGATNEQMLTLNRTIGQLGVIGGSSTTEMANGVRQFNQAMAGGIVRSEEWNSLLENVPEVAARIASGMGKTTGEMRQLVVEGKLFSREVFETLLSQSGQIQEDFDRMPPSISRAAESMQTAFGSMLQDLDRSLALTTSIASGMQNIANAMAGTSTSRDELVGRIARLEAELANPGSRGRGTGQGSLQSRVEAVRAELDQLDASTGNVAAFTRVIGKVDEDITAAEQALEEAQARAMQRSGMSGAAARKRVDAARATLAELVATSTRIRTTFAQAFAAAQGGADASDDTAPSVLVQVQRKRFDALARTLEGRRERIINDFVRTAKELQTLETVDWQDREAILRQALERRDSLLAAEDEKRQVLVAERAEQRKEALLEVERARIEALQNASERRLAFLVHERDLDLARVQEQHEQDLLTEAEYQSARLAIIESSNRSIMEEQQSSRDADLESLARRNAFAAKLARASADWEKKTASDKADFITSIGVEMTAALAQNSRAAFELNKVAATANAIINTHEGVTKALAKNNLVMAGLIAAKGAVEIAAIQSTNFGGGDSGIGRSSGIPSESNRIPGEAFATPVVSEADQNAASQRVIRIEIGASAGDAVTGALIEAIRTEVEDNDVEIVPASSRNARDIRSGSS